MSWWERREAAVDGPGAPVGDTSFFNVTCKLALRATTMFPSCFHAAGASLAKLQLSTRTLKTNQSECVLFRQV